MGRSSGGPLEVLSLSDCQSASLLMILPSYSIHTAWYRGRNHGIIDVADTFGLMVNLLKTKLLVMGYGLM